MLFWDRANISTLEVSNAIINQQEYKDVVFGLILAFDQWVDLIHKNKNKNFKSNIIIDFFIIKNPNKSNSCLLCNLYPIFFD